MADYLYIHIPFCLKKCIYCDFYSVSDSKSIIGAYMTALCKELEMRKEYTGELVRIYIGGGTPSILKEKDIAKSWIRFAALAISVLKLKSHQKQIPAH